MIRKAAFFWAHKRMSYSKDCGAAAEKFFPCAAALTAVLTRAQIASKI
jgi:hypothetical protein